MSQRLVLLGNYPLLAIYPIIRSIHYTQPNLTIPSIHTKLTDMENGHRNSGTASLWVVVCWPSQRIPTYQRWWWTRIPRWTTPRYPLCPRRPLPWLHCQGRGRVAQEVSLHKPQTLPPISQDPETVSSCSEQFMHLDFFCKDKNQLISHGSFKTNSLVSKEVGHRWSSFLEKMLKHWYFFAEDRDSEKSQVIYTLCHFQV